MKYRFSVLVTAYNEEENLEKAVNSLKALLEKECKDYEILIVFRESKDKTELIANQLAKKYKKVKAIKQKVPGFGAAIKEGYDKARMDYVWFVDADLPYDINDLKKSFPFLDDYDAVIGYKTGERENLFRSVMSFVYNRLMRLIFNFKFKDINYSYKIIKKKVINNLELKSNGWFITPEILIELNNRGYKVKEVLVPFKKRVTGASKVSNYPKTILYFLKEIFNHKRDQLLGRRV